MNAIFLPVEAVCSGEWGLHMCRDLVVGVVEVRTVGVWVVLRKFGWQLYSLGSPAVPLCCALS